MKHPIKVMLGILLEKGFRTLYLFTGNPDAGKALLSIAECWYEKNSQDWVLRKDSDPKHRSKK